MLPTPHCRESMLTSLAFQWALVFWASAQSGWAHDQSKDNCMHAGRDPLMFRDSKHTDDTTLGVMRAIFATMWVEPARVKADATGRRAQTWREGGSHHHLTIWIPAYFKLIGVNETVSFLLPFGQQFHSASLTPCKSQTNNIQEKYELVSSYTKSSA